MYHAIGLFAPLPINAAPRTFSCGEKAVLTVAGFYSLCMHLALVVGIGGQGWNSQLLNTLGYLHQEQRVNWLKREQATLLGTYLFTKQE